MLFVLKTSRNSFNLCFQFRNKSKTHWAKLKKKIGPKHKALNHFNDFYGSVYSNQWDAIRAGLIQNSKYVAVVNSFGNTEETIEYLTSRGAHSLKRLVEVQTKFEKDYNQTENTLKPPSNRKLDDFVAKVQTDDIENLYPNTNNIPHKLETQDVTVRSSKEIENDDKPKEDKIKNLTLDESLLEAEIDHSRVIDPSVGLTTESLWQYIPATQLKGMDEWVPDSLHYSYYTKGKDFPLIVEPETELIFPEHLNVYTYERDSEYTKFPEPKRCKTGVYNYYPMDCGSVLAVIALCLQSGDRVLDLCSGPGGKALVALQTLLPDVIICNDISISRSNRIHRIFKDYILDFVNSNVWRERVFIKNFDGRYFTDDFLFDKILVDVPCTTDRLSIKEDENNIFRPDRIKERLKLPELQAQLLVNALKLVRVGGAVVYSTCSLSPIQNDGVVHMALKQAFENHGVVATVKDLTPCMSGFSSTLELCRGESSPRYGQLVLPNQSANFGPSYFSRLVRTK